MDAGTVVFDRYELHEQIGAGGTSVVWRATDQLLHQTVALKRVSFAALGGTQAQLTRDRALREARLAARLRSHPNVIAVYDVLVDQSDIWLVMEYLPARSLRDILNTEGPLDPAEVARIGADLAGALAAAHALGIEHRDVKPGNVLIGMDGGTKLTDFGISHLAGDTHLTITGITGTPAYFAPEVVGTGESSPASDVFSLGATLYAAVEGQPPFGTDDNTFRLLNIVRTGIIRPPTRAGQLEPLLLRLLQLSPTTRPDAATTRELLTQLRGPTPAGGIRSDKPTRRRPRRWWPPRRRAIITAGALLSIVAVAVSVVILRTDPTGKAEAPSTAGLPTNISDPHQADPCALINLDSLRTFGDPRFATPPFLESCEVAITAIGGAETYLQVILYPAGGSVSELGGTPREVNGLPVARKDRVGVAGATGCQDWIAPAGQPWATITAFPYHDGSEDLCEVTEAATTAAAETLARNGGVVPAKPNRNAGYALALAEACATLDNPTLTKIPGLDPNQESPGFADWSCSWGAEGNGTRVQLHFGLRDDFGGLGDPSTPIAGKTTYRVSDPGNCDVYVVHRPARTGSRVAEIFALSIGSTVLPQIEACKQAADLATVVEEQLRRNPRDADPCALINLGSLRPFGDPQFGTGPWLQSCQADIETPNNDNVQLRVIFDDYEPASELEGEAQQLGERTVVRSGMVDYWGTDQACRHYLVLAADQPKIIIYALTYNDETTDLCAVAEAATTAALEALNRGGGITYTPDRTAIYSHAGSDACSLLDNSTLTTVPGLDPDQSPDYANWSCHWDTKDREHGVSLHLRLEAIPLSEYFSEELQPVTIAGKQAFFDGRKEKRCDVQVVHRSTPTTAEILELQVEAPLAADELCALATNLATTAEKYLPEG
ncbi:MAG: protein kinase domain-containing protein [Pseudonocardiaceae bacterium]